MKLIILDGGWGWGSHGRPRNQFFGFKIAKSNLFFDKKLPFKRRRPHFDAHSQAEMERRERERLRERLRERERDRERQRERCETAADTIKRKSSISKHRYL
jgi:hypothetical protein